jgi:hypothetical protein
MGILENEKEYVDFLVKNKLSTNQFLLLYLLYTERMCKSQGKTTYTKVGNIYKWIAEGKGWKHDEVEELIKLNYVIGFPINGKYQIDQLILTEKFFDLMFIDTEDAFNEILDLYPDRMVINNQTTFTKAGDLSKVADNYAKMIRNNLSKHEEMKKLVKYAAERGLCKYKIENFLSKGVIDAIKKEIGEIYESGADI